MGEAQKYRHAGMGDVVTNLLTLTIFRASSKTSCAQLGGETKLAPLSMRVIEKFHSELRMDSISLVGVGWRYE